MGWIHKCSQTFDNSIDMVGKIVEGETPLCPLYFIVAKAQIEMTITLDGSFVKAEEIPKTEQNTLIPVTESSSVRSCGVASHSLCDQIAYIATGSSPYWQDAKRKKKHVDYMANLRAWATSKYAHYIAISVLTYCKNGTIIDDLGTSGLISVTDDDDFEKEKCCGVELEKVMVRWRVIGGDTNGESWADLTFFESYRLFRESIDNVGPIDFCYVGGENTVIAGNHPRGIINFANGAKLLSANDKTGFTFRGRFETSQQAYSVGVEISQKAHNALRWLVANQGVFLGGRVFVCWNSEGKTLPATDSFEVWDDYYDDDDDCSSQKKYKDMLKRALAGYKKPFEGAEGDNGVQIISLDAATTGRLSITYYNELAGLDFIERIERWNESCCWHTVWFSSDKKPHNVVATPKLRRIIEFAFGTQQGDFVKVDDSIIKEHAQTILNCIIGGQPIPYYFVNALVQRSALRQAYSEKNYESLLFITCALLRKHNNEKKGLEEVKMELDVTNTNRSYLFGRLLAIAEKVERATYTAGESRDPNAIRLQSAFVQRPMRTWAVLDGVLNPYFARLNVGSRTYYKDLIGEIVACLNENDVTKLNKPLEDVYLIGYYLQRREFRNYNKNNNKEEE